MAKSRKRAASKRRRLGAKRRRTTSKRRRHTRARVSHPYAFSSGTWSNYVNQSTGLYTGTLGPSPVIGSSMLH